MSTVIIPPTFPADDEDAKYTQTSIRTVGGGSNVTVISNIGVVLASQLAQWSNSAEEAAVKVVLFCGGMGMRLRDYSEKIPKPLVEIGPRPVLWHLMRYYAHFGHTEFILCLGHGALEIKKFFLEYNEWATNDFVLTKGGREVELLGADIDEWRITFVETGLDSPIGERLRRVRDHVEGEEVFLANYSDGLTDLDLDRYVQRLRHDRQRRQHVERACAAHVPHHPRRRRWPGDRPRICR